MTRGAKAWRAAFCLAAAAMLAIGGDPAAAQGKPDAKSTAGARPESQANARAILKRMAETLAQAKAFSVRSRAYYDVVQRSGEKVEFTETRRLTVSRPNRMRVEDEKSDGSRVVTVFNGKEIALVDRTRNVYAVAPQPGDLDRTIAHFVDELGMQLPLALLLTSTLPAELDARVQSIGIVGRTSVYGAPAHHLAARGRNVDFQVWVTDGERALPQRVVITYRNAPGQPQYRAVLTDWSFTPDVSDAAFTAAIPQGAQKIAFAAQLPKLDRASGAKGEKK